MRCHRSYCAKHIIYIIAAASVAADVADAATAAAVLYTSSVYTALHRDTRATLTASNITPRWQKTDAEAKKECGAPSIQKGGGDEAKRTEVE